MERPGKEVMFQFKGHEDKEYGLGWHEEIIVDIVRKRVNSYKDLPIYLYQIQDKFRDEPRAKSGFCAAVNLDEGFIQFPFHRRRHVGLL